ncbi:mannosyltransferase putative-domain-containing protein [Xylariales sp. PMI_506]|nr:mannosyltransferase putative-domain-containing protein [Xylariales sp. PMI_506]
MVRLFRWSGPVGERLESCISRVPLPRRAHFTLVGLAAFTLVLYIFHLASFSLASGPWIAIVQHYGSTTEIHHTGVSSNVTIFWGDLLKALIAAEPDQTQVKPNASLQRSDFDPTFGDRVRLNLDIVNISSTQLASLKTNHQAFLGAIPSLVPKLPYEKDTRGIVITTNPDLLGVAITSLLMLRRSGSSLPVEVFLSNATEHGRALCDDALGPLGARCLNIEDFLNTLPRSSKVAVPELTRFQFKVFALLFSSFQSVLFLDADAFPVYNPDYLMTAEPFASYGLVTFPDFWVPTVSPVFWEVASPEGRAAAPNVTLSMRATESGIFLFDKKIHSDTLLLATYYNLYGPHVFYWLHSSGAWGTGDKETFRLSAQVLGNPVWHVRVGPDFITPDKIHDGSGIKQYDPEEDWMRYQNETAEAQAGRTPHSGAEDKKTPSRWIFVHTNRIKINARRMLKTLEIAKDKDGNWVRMWGPDSAPVIEAAGYDLEKAIWEELIKADCSPSHLEDCVGMHDFYNTIFRE